MDNNQIAEKEKKKPGKVIPLLLLILGIVIIGVGVFLMLKPKNSNNMNKNSSNEIKESTFMYNYGVYDFLISNPYQASANETYGLIIKNDNIIYTIGIDKTNSYDVYKSAYQTMHADNPEEVIVNKEEQEFIFEKLKDLDGNEAASYVTKSNEGETFLGMIVKRDYKEITTDDLNDLAVIIKESRKNEKAEGGKDMGFSGPKIFTFNKDDFSFES